MKKLLIGAVALTTALGSMAPAAMADDWGRRGDDRYDHRGDDRFDHRGDWDRRGDRWDHRGRGWDRGNHYGWDHRWRRGEYLGHEHWGRYGAVDYRSYHLRPPPRGYRYVRDDRGDILLAALATGLVVSVIAGSHY